VIPELADELGDGPSDPTPLLDYQATALQHKNYIARYLKYWESTIEHTGTGRVVDAVIMPVAPHAAVISGKYFHYGMLLTEIMFC
jgi:amidase